MAEKRGFFTSVAFFMVFLISATAHAGLEDNGDGTVTDTATGLMWQQATAPGTYNWDQAMAYCDGLEWAGFSDWRLPTIEELRSIVVTGEYPSIDATHFPGTMTAYYWSSSTIAGDAWRMEFGGGGTECVSKTGGGWVRAVRGGQSGALDFLIISSPSLASHWAEGDVMPISWDPAGIEGDVAISISRDGGKTYETIAAATPNDGTFAWGATGPETFNGALKIKPLTDMAEAAVQGFFSILIWPPRIAATAAKDGGLWQYALTLARTWSDGFVDAAPVIWESSDTAVAAVNGSTLTGIQNGWVAVHTTYEGREYTQRLPVYTTPQAMESGANDTMATANNLSAGSFYKAYLPSGDVDWFKFTIDAATFVELGLMSASAAADVKMEAFDAGGVLKGAVASTDGATRVLSLGLSAGTYYVKVSSDGDVDQDNYYVISHNPHDSLPVKTQTPLNFGDSVAGTIYHLQDQSLFSFNVPATQAVEISLTPAGDFARYLVEVLDSGQAVVDQVVCGAYLPVRIKRIFGPGAYTIRISPMTDIDAANPFTLSIETTADQVETEPNDTAAGATVFDVTKAMTGRLGTGTDVDVFAFDLAVPRFVELKFSCPGSAEKFNLSLYKDSEANQIDGVTAQSYQKVSLHLGLAIGRYYLKVASDDPDTVNYYTLEVIDSPQTNLEIESNNTLRVANALEKNSVKKGRIYSAGDKDYFGFHLPEAAVFTASLIPSTASGDYTLVLVDENDTEIDYRLSSNGGAVTLEAYNYPGNYFYRVEPSGDIDQFSPYELTLDSTSAITGLKQLVSVTIAGTQIQMETGAHQQLSATASYSDVTSEAVASPIWTSLSPSVAEVDAAGVVTAKAEGSTTIIATYGGVSGRYDLTVGAPTMTYAQHHGNLILVAGGGVDATNTLKESTQYLSDLVYGRFRGRLFQNEDIFYINPMTWHDVDGDGYDDNIVDDASPTVAEFGAAVTTWASDQSTDGPLYVYLIDHGGIDKFSIFPGQTLTAVQLDAYLDAFQAATGRKVVVVIEACKSGSFTDDLTTGATDRVVVTSTDNLNAYLDLDGRISFSQFLVDSLYAGDSVQNAFNKAGQKLSKMGLPYNQMVPQLVEAPMTLAGSTYVGGSFAIAGLYPEIIETSASQTVAAGGAHGFYAVLSDLEGIERVWAVVIPPDYVPPETSADLSAPQVTLPSFDLTDPDGDGRFDGTYSGFTFSDVYKITFYASNANGNVGISPASIDVTVTGGAGLDTDGDGMPNDWEDQYAGLNSNVDDGANDPDGDTLSNFQEYQKSTSPINADTDGDGMNDGWEVAWGFNPNLNDANADADGDGVTNIVEYADGTNPINGGDYLDHVPPQVTLTAPVNGEVNVARGVSLVMTFSEAMNTGTLSAGQVSVLGSVTGTHVGSITYDAVNHKLTLLPATVFDYGEMVSVTLSSAVTDVAGNTLDGDKDGVAEGSPMDDYVWNFTIEESPLVSPPNPYDANADWKIGDFELLDAIDAWAMGQMATLIGASCDVDFYLLDVIDLWKAPGYLYDVGAGDACFTWKVQ